MRQTPGLGKTGLDFHPYGRAAGFHPRTHDDAPQGPETTLESPLMSEPTLYDQVGGMPFFERLVDRFYEGVKQPTNVLPAASP